MPKDTLTERGKGLEDEFFRKREKEVLQRLRAKHARDESLSALAEVCGFSDENVLGRLVDLGRVETGAHGQAGAGVQSPGDHREPADVRQRQAGQPVIVVRHAEPGVRCGR